MPLSATLARRAFAQGDLGLDAPEAAADSRSTITSRRWRTGDAAVVGETLGSNDATLLSANGGKTYSKPEADRALALTVEFFKRHLGGAGNV